MRLALLSVFGWAWGCVIPAVAAAEMDPLAFHQQIYAMQQKQIANRAIRTEQETGDYQGAAAGKYSFVDTRYYDAANGQLLSRVRRDADNPEFVHIVEVNLYENGRLVRDFGSITMPWAPKVPERTMINLHHYNGELHSFRQFNVYGDISFESCQGKFEGKKIRFYLDASDIDKTSTSTPVYKACFGEMTKKWDGKLSVQP